MERYLGLEDLRMDQEFLTLIHPLVGPFVLKTKVKSRDEVDRNY